MSYSLESKIGEVIAWILDLEDMTHLHILIQKPHILIFAFWKTNGSGIYSGKKGVNDSKSQRKRKFAALRLCLLEISDKLYQWMLINMTA